MLKELVQGPFRVKREVLGFLKFSLVEKSCLKTVFL